MAHSALGKSCSPCSVILIVSLLASTMAVPAVWAQMPDHAIARPPSLAPMLTGVLPAVVSLKVSGKRLVPRDLVARSDVAAGSVSIVTDAAKSETFTSSGSGVIIDASGGLIVTNHHVIEQASTIEATLHDGRRLPARIVGIDPATDLALLAVSATGLVDIPAGDSDALRIGDYVVAIGNPLGLTGSASQGIVSGLKRSDVGYETIEDFIQTDAAINKGNSGGALVNLRGELVGINTASVGSAGSIGIGFAIPARIVMGVVGELRLNGRIERGVIGIRTETFTREVADQLKMPYQKGALISRVLPKSPAAEAGLAAGDIVVAFNGNAIRSAADFVSGQALGFVGRSVDVEVVRGTRRIRHRITISAMERPRQPVPVTTLDVQRLFKGLVLGALEPGLPLFGELQGVFVIEVELHSALHAAGLASGDVIVAFDAIKVRSPQEALQVIELVPRIERLQIVRDGVPYWVRLPS